MLKVVVGIRKLRLFCLLVRRVAGVRRVAEVISYPSVILTLDTILC